MRHSVLELKMNTYADPKRLDVAMALDASGAVDVLPDLPLDDPQSERQRATGTDGRELVPGLVSNAGNRSTPDLVYPARLLHKLAVRRNLGNAAFGPAEFYPADHYPQYLAVADLNQNGYRDVAVAGSYNAVSLFLNQSAPPTSLDLNHNGIPDECDVPGDLDGDGLVSSADFPALCDCMGGPGTTIAACALADFDADGDVDLMDAATLQTLCEHGGGD